MPSRRFYRVVLPIAIALHASCLPRAGQPDSPRAAYSAPPDIGVQVKPMSLPLSPKRLEAQTRLLQLMQKTRADACSRLDPMPTWSPPAVMPVPIPTGDTALVAKTIVMPNACRSPY
jgi:hypothetical protein